jgi:hypothetical protein
MLKPSWQLLLRLGQQGQALAMRRQEWKQVRERRRRRRGQQP